MTRAYFDCSFTEFSKATDEQIVGALALAHGGNLDGLQLRAWSEQISHLRAAISELESGHLFVEFAIPRMGKRADAVLLLPGLGAVLEYKVGAEHCARHALDQVVDYALDLKNFHEGSHALPLVPILVATNAQATEIRLEWYPDGLAYPVCTNEATLPTVLARLPTKVEAAVSADTWVRSRYKPTPTIVEAATALYEGHNVKDISRSDAGAINLSRTADQIESIIEEAKRSGQKAICFITGVPGSGKTLAGLNIATRRSTSHEDEHAVFLSGNGPLVAVLREALARDEVDRFREAGSRMSMNEARRQVSSFIQNVHHFRDECLKDSSPPTEKVVVFDEAQRAWSHERTSQFMRERKGIKNFEQSEPAFLLSAMDRHADWCVVVCLIGTGQEINRGEAGMEEWFRALGQRFGDWVIYASPKVAAPDQLIVRKTDALHLGVSVRSFRSERVSDFVSAVIAGNAKEAAALRSDLTSYPIVITRNLERARDWLRSRARGTERFGLVASSNALRLRPFGLHVKSRVDVTNWFLGDSSDVRSSMALEDAASEFEVQGLELDWVGVCWDANFRREDSSWGHYRFSGTRWSAIGDPERRTYLENAYRVLLTRARQGMVIFVPSGSPIDRTRAPRLYDPTYDFLVECGIEEL
jgi:hypothetical protein